MSTPKPLYAHERVMYHPELLTCPHGGDLLVMCNSLGWDKTVPRLDRVLSVASRAGRCPPRPRASPPWSCWLGASGRGASALASAGASTGSAPHPVWSKNSCGFARVVFQEPPEPFPTLYRTLTRRVWADRRKEQDIALALMIPLVMKMRHILRQRMAE